MAPPKDVIQAFPFMPEKAEKAHSYRTLDQCINHSSANEMGSISSLLRNKRKPTKRRKEVDKKPVFWVRFNNRVNDTNKPIMLKALLDSGGSGTLIAKQYVKELSLEKLDSKQQWITPAGVMNTTSLQLVTQFEQKTGHSNVVTQFRHMTGHSSTGPVTQFQQTSWSINLSKRLVMCAQNWSLNQFKHMTGHSMGTQYWSLIPRS